MLLALSPTYAIELCIVYKGLAFFVLGAVVLCVTGAEALYADMGHFGAKPIRISWMFFVLPVLVLNYFGQGALVLRDPAAIAEPVLPAGPRLDAAADGHPGDRGHRDRQPGGDLRRLFGDAAMHAAWLPAAPDGAPHLEHRGRARSTCRRSTRRWRWAWSLLVLAFKTSDSLASAYGIAVTGTFLCTAMLAMVVFRRQFHWSRTAAIAVFGALFLIDGVFFAANTLKIVEGGWVPLVLGIALIALMTSWKRGRDLLLARWRQDSMPLAPFLARLPQSRIIRVPGLAVFLTGNQDYVPTSLLHNLKHNKVLHENVMFVTVQNVDVPEVSQTRRADCRGTGAGHPPRDAALRLHGKPEHPARAGGTGPTS